MKPTFWESEDDPHLTRHGLEDGQTIGAATVRIDSHFVRLFVNSVEVARQSVFRLGLYWTTLWGGRNYEVYQMFVPLDASDRTDLTAFNAPPGKIKEYAEALACGRSFRYSEFTDLRKYIAEEDARIAEEAKRRVRKRKVTLTLCGICGETLKVEAVNGANEVRPCEACLQRARNEGAEEVTRNLLAS